MYMKQENVRQAHAVSELHTKLHIGDAHTVQLSCLMNHNHWSKDIIMPCVINLDVFVLPNLVSSNFYQVHPNDTLFSFF